jgi:hypothetical protein
MKLLSHSLSKLRKRDSMKMTIMVRRLNGILMINMTRVTITGKKKRSCRRVITITNFTMMREKTHKITHFRGLK